MNIPLQLKCPECGTPATQRIHLSASSLGFRCAHCGHQHVGIFGLDVSVGILMLERSRYELIVEKDFDMAIVLAAAALDCEVSQLFFKWKQIAALGAGVDIQPEVYEEQLRSLGNVASKIGSLSGLLYPGGVEAFVTSSPGWTKTIKDGFPSLRCGSLGADFQRTVFWPRNKVLHQGYAQHSEQDASECYSIADLGIRIFKDMDKAKVQAAGL